MARNLIVIYGSPRTGTSHLFDALIRHPECFGSHGKEGTNEPSRISFDEDGLVEVNRLWDLHRKDGREWMILKAPGFCFGWDFFRNLPGYTCKYLYCDRDMAEVVNSMMSHEPSRKFAQYDFDSTDCPEGLKEKFRPLWNNLNQVPDEERVVSRMFYRYRWHVDSIPMPMLQASLRVVPYEARLYSHQIASLICAYTGLKGHGGTAWVAVLRDFWYRRLTHEKIGWIRNRIIY